jgi:tetratricopeptide (TPR) repeat protein
MQPPPIDRARSEVFRERMASFEEIKGQLAGARDSNKVELIETIQNSLGDISSLEPNVVMDLLLSYRSVGAYDRMLQLVKGMDRTLSQTTMVRQLQAFAQNRLGQSREAEDNFKQVIAAQGPSSEVNGLLGRVYKDRWENAKKAGDVFIAKANLRQAIQTYLEGFEADWRDAYPGINAVTLMEVADDPRRQALIPVVRYSVERRLARKGTADYWDHATRLELAVLMDDADTSADALGDAFSIAPEVWQLETTARNLRLIADARTARNGNANEAGVAVEEITKRVNILKSR